MPSGGSTSQDPKRKSTAPRDEVTQRKIHEGLFMKVWARLREDSMKWCSVLGLVAGRTITTPRERGE